MNEKSKAIIIVGLIIVVLSGAFLCQGYLWYGKSIDLAIKQRENEISASIADLEKFSFTGYRNRIKNLLDVSPGIVEALARRDREELYRRVLPKYTALKLENEFFQIMHFHLPDSTSFLRMHSPELYGDDLRTVRPMINDVHGSHKPNFGFEIGKFGPFYRVVHPVFHEGEYIGALELGVMAYQVLKTVEQKVGAKAASFFLASQWRKVTQVDSFKTVNLGKYVMISHGNPLYEHLPPDFNLDLDGQELEIAGNSYIAHSHLIFTDYHGESIGGILFLQDITPMLAQKKIFLLKGLSFSAFLLILALIALYFIFGSIMDRLLREIRERKNVEARLAEDRQRLRTVFDSSPAAVFIHDMDGTIIDVNKTMLEMYEVDKEEGLKLSIAEDYSAPENDPEFLANVWREAIAGKPWEFDWLARRPHDGSTFVTHVNLEKIYFGDRDVIYATVQDISARKRMEAELAAEREHLAVTLRSIGDGVIATDIRGRVVLINKVAEKLTGWGQEEALGKPATEVFNIINEKTGRKCASPVQRVLEMGRIIGLANHTALIARDGTVKSIADSGAPIRDRASKTVGVVLVFRDITNEKRMQDELLKARKLESVGILAGGIAHDFNNILMAILGNIELARCRIPRDDLDTDLLLAEAEKATKRATKLTGQLLTFSKGGDPIKDATSLPELIAESADFVLHGSHVSCHYNFPAQLWAVDADSGQIGQVIQNIILNAKHAMPEGGIIEISCDNVEDAAAESLLSADHGHYVRIVIKDAGIGIPREIIDKIFDPYFSTKREGSGLGLAICHSIINKHDGYIKVDSKPGQGTTFTIYLPAAGTIDHAVPEKMKTVRRAVKACRIMVMDDEKMLLDLAAAQLEALGHEAVLAPDGEQAVNRYQEMQDSGTPVDLVIMDLTIPGGMGGKEAAEKLLKVDSQAKIIVASGYSNDPVMADYRRYGFCAAIPKPFDIADLSRAIEQALGQGGKKGEA